MKYPFLKKITFFLSCVLILSQSIPAHSSDLSLPDLFITHVQVVDNGPRIVVKNGGNLPSGDQVTVTIYSLINGQLQTNPGDTCSIPEIMPQQEGYCDLPQSQVNILNTDEVFGIIIDELNSITETNEFNNRWSNTSIGWTDMSGRAYMELILRSQGYSVDSNTDPEKEGLEINQNPSALNDRDLPYNAPMENNQEITGADTSESVSSTEETANTNELAGEDLIQQDAEATADAISMEMDESSTTFTEQASVPEAIAEPSPQNVATESSDTQISPPTNTSPEITESSTASSEPTLITPSVQSESPTTSTSISSPDQTQDAAPQKRRTSNRKKPAVPPDHPFYFIRTLFQETRSVFTFDAGKRAALRLQYARDKVLESYDLAQQGKEDVLTKHLQRYQKDLQKLLNTTKKIRSEKQASAISQLALENTVRHQILLEYVEQDATEKQTMAIRNIREDLYEQMSSMASGLNANAISSALHKGLKQEGSSLSLLQHASVLTKLEPYLSGSEDAKKEILTIKKELGGALIRSIANLSKRTELLVPKYVQKTGIALFASEDAVEDLRTLIPKTTDTKEMIRATAVTGTSPVPAKSEKKTLQVPAQAPKPTAPAPTIPSFDSNESSSPAQENDSPCDDPYNPVCGTDGITYVNACTAERQLVGIAYKGACSQPQIPTSESPQQTPDAIQETIPEPVATTPPPASTSENDIPSSVEPEENEQEEEVVRTPNFNITLTQSGNNYTVNGMIEYYGKGGNCEGPRPSNPVIVRWGDGANEPTVSNMSFTASHEYHIKNGSYTLSVSVYNSCYQMKTITRTITFDL